MEWLLAIVLVSPMDYTEFEPIRFATKAECVVAAQAFVERYPAFEWRDRLEPRTENPVVRSYVECVPAPSDQDD